MKFKIHRGTKEIGGSCVEVWTENTRILLDFGMPLVDKNGKEFDFNKFKNLTATELVEQGILPKIKGLYDCSDCLIDGVIISHSHQDHCGLVNYINDNIPFYLGKATHKIIEINNLFVPQKIVLHSTNYFEKSSTFKIGDFFITPYWVDHSAFDAYSFLIEANGKRLFYSGDFRSHGRKRQVFYWFTHNAPQNVDYLLLEGTTIGRDNKPFKTEWEIEDELIKLFEQQNRINLIYTSGQNIDRLTSIYRACKKTGKIFVIDVYVAQVLKDLSKYAAIPHPSDDFKNLKVMFPFYTCRRLKNEGNEKLLFQFRKYKITKDEIRKQSGNIVMVVRASMQKDLAHIHEIENGNFIYSMWHGYFTKPMTKKIVDYLKGRNCKVYYIHTNGHADRTTLKKIVGAIKPKNIVPIHTFDASQYKNIFAVPIVELKDEEIREV